MVVLFMNHLLSEIRRRVEDWSLSIFFQLDLKIFAAYDDAALLALCRFCICTVLWS